MLRCPKCKVSLPPDENSQSEHLGRCFGFNLTETVDNEIKLNPAPMTQKPATTDYIAASLPQTRAPMATNYLTDPSFIYPGETAGMFGNTGQFSSTVANYGTIDSTETKPAPTDSDEGEAPVLPTENAFIDLRSYASILAHKYHLRKDTAMSFQTLKEHKEKAKAGDEQSKHILDNLEALVPFNLIIVNKKDQVQSLPKTERAAANALLGDSDAFHRHHAERILGNSFPTGFVPETEKTSFSFTHDQVKGCWGKAIKGRTESALVFMAKEMEDKRYSGKINSAKCIKDLCWEEGIEFTEKILCLFKVTVYPCKDHGRQFDRRVLTYFVLRVCKIHVQECPDGDKNCFEKLTSSAVDAVVEAFRTIKRKQLKALNGAEQSARHISSLPSSSRASQASLQQLDNPISYSNPAIIGNAYALVPNHYPSLPANHPVSRQQTVHTNQVVLPAAQHTADSHTNNANAARSNSEDAVAVAKPLEENLGIVTQPPLAQNRTIVQTNPEKQLLTAAKVAATASAQKETDEQDERERQLAKQQLELAEAQQLLLAKQQALDRQLALQKDADYKEKQRKEEEQKQPPASCAPSSASKAPVLPATPFPPPPIAARIEPNLVAQNKPAEKEKRKKLEVPQSEGKKPNKSQKKSQPKKQPAAQSKPKKVLVAPSHGCAEHEKALLDLTFLDNGKVKSYLNSSGKFALSKCLPKSKCKVCLKTYGLTDERGIHYCKGCEAAVMEGETLSKPLTWYCPSCHQQTQLNAPLSKRTRKKKSP